MLNRQVATGPCLCARWSRLLRWMLVAFAVLAVPPCDGFAADDGDSRLRVTLGELTPESLAIKYWYRGDEPVSLKDARAGSFDLPIVSQSPYAAGGAGTAVMFLLDTSDPGRQKIVDAQVEAVRKMREKAGSHISLALAVFDKDMSMLADFVSAPEAFDEALKEIKAKGLTTELWRNTLQAIDLVAAQGADRKAVFVFSDGKAEDSGYTLADVVSKAQETGVIVYGFGYAVRASESIDLQMLRRLAEETGGQYVEADASFDLPEGFLEQPFKALDNGGTAVVGLREAIQGGLYESTTLDLTFSVGDDQRTASLPLAVSGVVDADAVQRRYASELPEPLRPLARVPVIAAVGGAIVLAIIVFAVIAMRRRRPPYEESPRPIARFRLLDGEETVFPMLGPAVRIGRSDENDIVLKNTSVSNFHAQVHRARNGAFTITDLDSLNGVSVNGERFQSAELQWDDVIELGEVRVAFEEPTAADWDRQG